MGLPLTSLLAFASAATLQAPGPAPRQGASRTGLPRSTDAIRFEQNRGQAPAQFRYVARNGHMALYLGERSATFALRGAGKREVVPVTLRWRDASGSGVFSGGEPQKGITRYIRGNDPRRWIDAVPAFGSVRQASLYPGIDLVYYGSTGRLEYDFVVKPGADASRIGFDVQGGQSPHLSPTGDLIVDGADSPFVLRRPAAYQTVNGRRKQVASRYVLSSRSVSLALGKYDQKVPLVIDPAVIYSTYLGGSGWESDPILNVDAAGNATICGSTQSLDLPVQNAVQPAFRGNYDGCIIKLDPNGGLLYATYFGGSDTDYLEHAVIDSQGGVIVSGVTQSTDFPTSNAFQPLYGPQQSGYLTVVDHFVAHLDAAGALVYSTYCGGVGYLGAGITFGDSPYLALDGNDNVALTFRTNVTGFPMVNAAQPAPGGIDDAIVAKIDPAGNLIYSTYWGGSATENPRGVCADAAGNVVIAGGTGSSDFPLHNAARATGGIFAAKFSPSGANLWSTRWGGTVSDPVSVMGMDGSGGVVVAGTTTSADFPLLNATQGTLAGGNDNFLMRLTSGGNVVYSTYLGGSLDEGPAQIAVAADGSAVVVGGTYSHNYPVLNAVQATNPSADLAGFVSRISPTGALVYSSYYTGAVYGALSAVTLDSSGNAYVAGRITGAGPAFVNPIQYSGPNCGLLAVLDPTGAQLFCSPVFTNPSAYGYANAVALDALGHAYVAGSTNDVDMPTKSAVRPDGPYLWTDFYLAKLDLGAPGLLVSTVGNDHLAGYAATGYVTLSPAPGGGAVVSLSSNDPVVTIPATVTIPAGANTVSFPVTSTDVTSTHAVQLTANYNGLSWTQRFRVQSVLLHSFNTAQSTIFGSQSTTIRLRAEALHDTTVTFSSTDGSVHPPASIVYPAGAPYVDVTVTSDFVPTDRTAVVSASAGGRTLPKTLTIWATKVQSLGVPAVIVSGRSAQGSVQLYGPIPPDGYTVSLTSSNPSVLSVPSTVTVTDTQTFAASFPITAGAVSADTDATISAAGTANTLTQTVSVQPLHVAGVSITPTLIIGGNGASGTVTMNGTVDSDLAVGLTSDNAALTVPASVTIQAGQDHANFSVTTSTVSTAATPTVTATTGAFSKTTTVTVAPLTITSATATDPIVVGGASLFMRVLFNGPVPPGGASVTLSSDHPEAATGAAMNSVSAGATSALIPVTTSPVTADTTATLTCGLPSGSKSDKVQVRAAALYQLSFSPGAVYGGSPSTGRVYLTGNAPAGGFTFNLSSDKGAVTVPASVTVPAGLNTYTFTANTSPVTTDTTATITATHGAQSISAALVVASPALTSVAVSPGVTVGTNTVTCTVSLTSAAASGGALVKLTSSSAAAPVPASITIPAGSASATFSIATAVVTKNTSVTITATYKGVKKQGALSVLPALKTLGLKPTSVVGGANSTGTITLNGSVPGGITVNLSSANPAATVPASVFIAEGSTSGTFTVTTTPVSASTAGPITATAAGVTKSASLTVKPPALSAIAFSPKSILSGGTTTGTLTLTGPAPPGFQVGLTSGDPAALAVPASVTFTAGSKTATFTATAGTVTAKTTVTVTGKDPAGVTKSGTVTVSP